MPEVITSRQNPQVKLLDALLRQKKERENSGLFVLEGARLCLDAHRAGILPQKLFATPGAIGRDPALSALAEASGEVILLDESLAARIADTRSTQGVFAVCRQSRGEPAPLSPQGKYLLLHEIRDPGNLGSVLRTAAALGVTGVFLSQCAELYAPKVLRASMGGVWRTPVSETDGAEAAIDSMRRCGIKVYAAALRQDAAPPRELSCRDGCAVLIGNEGTGLPDELIDLADETVMIPMRGGTESLGAAMAAGILIWEMLR